MSFLDKALESSYVFLFAVDVALEEIHVFKSAMVVAVEESNILQPSVDIADRCRRKSCLQVCCGSCLKSAMDVAVEEFMSSCLLWL